MQVAQLNEACVGLDDEFKKYKEQLLEETSRVRDQKKKNKKVKKAMTQEVHSLTDECASLTQREETTLRGITEARETIEALGETFDDLNEQVLRLDLKLN
jgi:predicted  nucleic acid-binding Zn-ribbon protein